MCEQHPLSIRIAQWSKSLLISPQTPPAGRARAPSPSSRAVGSPWAASGQTWQLHFDRATSFGADTRLTGAPTNWSCPRCECQAADPRTERRWWWRWRRRRGGGHGSGGDAGCCDGGCGCRGNDILRAMRQRAPPPSVARPATAALCSRDRAAVQVEARASTQHSCRL